MILKVDLDDMEIQQAIQNQLDGGPTLQVHFKAALRFFNRMLQCEKACKSVGDKMAVIKEERGYIKNKSDIIFPSEVFKEEF